MDAPLNQVFTPVTFQELFSTWNRFTNAVIYAGGTNLIGIQEKNILNLPPILISLDKIPELHRITRTEHYLEIGSMVKLNKLISLGKTVPKVLRDCLENIAGVQLRNVATIGGNICSLRLLNIPAPLVALDAQYEFKNSANNSRWVSAARFHSPLEQTSVNSQELLTRIRLPLHQWDYTVYKKITANDYFDNDALVFLAKTKKDVLSEIRVIYKKDTILRNKSGENILNGKSLPLNRKTADDFIDNWIEFINQKKELTDFDKNIIISNIKDNIYNLSE